MIDALPGCFVVRGSAYFNLRIPGQLKFPWPYLEQNNCLVYWWLTDIKGTTKSALRYFYCYAHLLRKVEDLGKQFIDEVEVQCFVGTFAPLLSKAMHLRTTSISNKIYYKKALLIKREIVKVVDSPSKHLGIKEIQLIFKENKDRLYHWVCDRRVPAENNRAERELRPTVIARKVSFGSQSEKGAQTRSILMTILHTAQKRLKTQTLEDWLKETLDKLALNPNLAPYTLLPP